MHEHCPHCGVRLPAIRDAFCPECRNDLTESPVGPVSPIRLAPEKRAGRKPPSVWIAQGLLLFLAIFVFVRVLFALTGLSEAAAGPYIIMLARNSVYLFVVLWPVVALERRQRHAHSIAGVVLLALWGMMVYATIESLREESQPSVAENGAYWIGEVMFLAVTHGGLALLIFRLCFGGATRAYLAADSLSARDREPAPTTAEPGATHVKDECQTPSSR